jgi:hypothetical protein
MINIPKTLLVSAFLPILALAQGDSRRAEIRGGGGNGKCTIEVEVDGVAEVIIDREMAYLRTVEGQPATWRRFVCNQPMPSNPNNFRFRGIDGRGRQILIRTPQQNRGRAVIQIEDPRGGRHGYTFDVEWDGGFDNGGAGRYDRDDRDDRWRNDRRDRDRDRDRDWDDDNRNNRRRNWDPRQAERACASEVEDRIRRDYNLSNVRIDRIRMDNNRGANDSVFGQASGRQRNRTIFFDFDCRVNLNNGNVRDVRVTERR